MGLLGGIARTAVVAGTATAVSNRVSRRQAQRWAARDQRAAEEEYSYAHAGQAPEDGMSDQLEQLRQLGDLRAQGLLTDVEFERQKARILGG